LAAPVRGGSWRAGVTDARVSYRGGCTPMGAVYSSSIGFRLASSF